MGYDMSIAAMSVSMHQQQASQDFGIAVMKMAMDQAAGGTEELLEDLEALSVDPNLGANIDIQA